MSKNARNNTESESRTLTIVVIDSRALIRDCLANSLRTMNEGWVIRTFASIDEWHSVQSNFSSAVIVLYAQDRQADDVECELAQLAQSEPCFPTLVMSDAEDLDLVHSGIFPRGSRIHSDKHVIECRGRSDATGGCRGDVCSAKHPSTCEWRRHQGKQLQFWSFH